MTPDYMVVCFSSKQHRFQTYRTRPGANLRGVEATRRTIMKHVILCAAVWLTFIATGFAQGIQTGTIRGVVKDSQNLPVPGVTVTVTSSALQGPRSVTTD